MKTVSLALAGLVMMVGTIAVPLPASAQTSGILDPVGDTKHRGPAFQDIVRAEIEFQKTEEDGGTFFLLMEMAGPVPENPSLPPPGASELWWIWVFDLDPTTTPRGYPFSRGVGIVHGKGEFLVYVAWDGTEFTGTAIDRRPLLTGEDAIITPVLFSFSIDRTIVEAELDSSLIGNPSSFGWRVATRDWSSSPGTEASTILMKTTSSTLSPFRDYMCRDGIVD
jgi:hypothetical protein